MDENVVIYSYYFNINFGFNDSEAFKMEVNGTEVIIYFERIEHKTYHPYKGENPNWVLQNGISFDLAIPNSLEGQDVIGEYFIEKTDIFSTGYTRIGIANIINIRFNSNIPPERRETFAEECLKRFLDVYRLLTFHGYGDNYLNKKNTVFRIQEGILRNGNQFRQDVLNHGVIIPSPRLDILPSFRQQERIKEQIAGRLMIDKELEVYEKMLNVGKKLFIYDEDYPLAIVMFGTAFETYVQLKLKKLCENQGIDQLHVKDERYGPYEEVIERSNINPLLTKHLPYLTDVGNIRNTPVYMTWKTNAYLKRNQIIHRGNINFNKEDAEKAYFAIIDFIEFIHAL